MPSTITFLDAINEVLKLADVIKNGDELTSFVLPVNLTHDVDLARRAWAIGLTQMRRMGAIVGEAGEGTLTLETDKVSYSFTADMSLTDFVAVTGAFVNTGGFYITPYPLGGRDDPWLAMREDIPDRSDHTGRPRHYALNLSSGNLELDTTPTASENGETYLFTYDKKFGPSDATDTFDLTDAVVESLYPAVAEIFSRYRTTEFNNSFFQTSMADAVDLNRGTPAQTKYGPRFTSH